ncbi:MAG TPA: acyl-CoA dehydrogenase family protein [Candidatus Limnocylindrales bacterium]|nr:acyl-CoA dehydrogenase family protein [Candidatus Limnocylindrales bacterium]
MDFGLTDEQRALAETLRRYLADECPATRVRTAMESENGHDAALWQGLCDLGVLALAVPETLGGMGDELLSLALVSEQIGYAAAPGPFVGAATAVVALANADDADAAASWLPRIASGEALATAAVGESGGRWDADELAAKVDVDNGDGVKQSGQLRGTKSQVPYGSLADLHVVAARDGDDVAVWIVERARPAVVASDLSGNDLTRRLSSVEYRGAEARRIGGRRTFEKMRDAALILLAADAYGGARRCLDMAREYALTREQFGQPIGAFQAVKHQLANLAVEIEPSMSLWWYAAHAFDRIPDQAPRHAALAKAFSSDLFDRAARDSTELHGGIGFTWEFDLHLWLRRSMFDRAFFGDAHYHRARAAALAGW